MQGRLCVLIISNWPQAFPKGPVPIHPAQSGVAPGCFFACALSLKSSPVTPNLFYGQTTAMEWKQRTCMPWAWGWDQVKFQMMSKGIFLTFRFSRMLLNGIFIIICFSLLWCFNIRSKNWYRFFGVILVLFGVDQHPAQEPMSRFFLW